jgi:hypothetical protein
MLEQIKNLEDQYKDNPYMLKRLHFHLTQILPKTLQNELQNWEKRKERNQNLIEDQKIFIQIFLSKNDYYYLPQTNTFYEYDKNTYKVIREDDVIYQLLSSISKDRKLMQWKHKTKYLLLKQIKERNLFQSIPETVTIHRVIGALVPSLFTDKKSAKYFLTILGDAILKKSGDLIFLVKPKTKPLLQELDSLLLKTINLANVTSNIMTKYHESYLYTNCRLLKINTASADLNIIRSLGLDLICIATYYSHNRYSSSDNYLNTLDEQHDLKTYSLFLKNNTSKTIIDSFFQFAKIEAVTNPDQANIYKSKVCINWKNMHYIWKLYISKNSLPFMFYSNTLKNLLKERIQYDELADTFYGVTSKYLPYVSEVLHFWEETITFVESPDHSFDIDELCELFKKRATNQLNKTTHNISENDLVKIVAHFFPSVEIVEAKYILNISCSLWNKSTDIIAALDQLKESYKTDTSSLILIDDAYKYYLKFCRKNKSPMVANKRYFEQWIHHNMADLIQFEKFIKWISETN